ncbi:GNAT family N-acetyltransferase [Candidatus Bipolaricaulota bacterium]|nr:GNAT family N-acetyltransferase [Candidatus Bipolaricaulota bacterium]
MDRLATIRPYRLGHDTEEACRLEAAAFTEDYRRMGEDPRLESKRERNMERLIVWISRAIPALRLSRLGYVVEQDRRMASIVLFARDGLKGTCWSIDAVGTHPDFQRRGLAKRLLGRVFESIREHGGESCTLKVRRDNAAAYRLYQALGFTHFHTSHQMRRVGGSTKKGRASHVDGLGSIDQGAWYALWRERLALSVRTTPSHVLEYKPVAESDFRRSWLIRVLGPWAMKLGGCRFSQWIVRKEGRLVATLRTRADLTGNRSHEIRLSIDPDWRSELADPLVQMACDYLEKFASKGTLIEVGGQETALLNALTDKGFEDISVWHWLGVSVDQAIEALREHESGLDNVTV